MAQGDETIFSKEIEVFSDQVQDLETAINDLYNLRGVLTATGKTLDYVGEQVGATRPYGMSDTDFRALVNAQIQMNMSGGEPERLIAAITALAAATSVSYQDYYLMVSLEFAGTVISNLWNTIRRIVSGGVGLRLVQCDATTPFQFDTAGRGLDEGKLGNLLS